MQMQSKHTCVTEIAKITYCSFYLFSSRVKFTVVVLEENHGKFSSFWSNWRWMDVWKIHWFFGFENASTLHSRSSVALRLRHEFSEETILGDPGAASRDDAIFSGESLLQELKSPWELILTESVPEIVEFRPPDWAEKYFSALSAMRSSRVTLSPSYTK